MYQLFSHAPHPEGEEPADGERPPSRAVRVLVAAPREIVYSAFVGDLHLWWPAAYTGFGEETHAFIEDGIMGEEGPDGAVRVWGEVTREEPGELVEVAWTLAWRPDAPTRVRFEFAERGNATLVTATHDGWAPGAEGAQQYAKYDEWDLILGRFAAFFGQPPESVEVVTP